MKSHASQPTAHGTTKKKSSDDATDMATFDTATMEMVPVAPMAPALAVSQASTPSPTVTKEGNEFSANSITAGGQFFSSIATFPDGSYVISWTDTSYTDGEENAGIRAQIFDKNNNKVGKEFRVNTTVAGGQYQSQIAILASGDFVITWNDEGATGGDKSGDAVRGQMYHRDGSKMGSEFIVNTSTTGDQENSSVTALANGGFVVTWQDGSKTGGDASGLSIKAQVYDAGGQKVGGEFLVNTVTKNDQELASVTALQGVNSGGFLAVWEDHSFLNNDLTRDGSIKGQRFDANGNKVGGEFLVDTKGSAYVNTAPSVIGLSNGGYAVTWQAQSDNPTNNPAIDDDDSNIQLQVFNADGTKASAQIQVNMKGEEYQQAPKITQLTNGYIVVTWEDVEDGTGDHGEIKARIFDQQGHAVGNEFTVNDNSAGEQHTPAIAALPDGRFMISWTDNNVAGDDDDGIRARIFSVGGVAGTISDETLTGGTVAENSANGTVVGTVSGVDALPGAVLTFALADNAGGRFAIDSKTGVITVANGSLLDFETGPAPTIKVLVSDQSGQSFTKTFTINVTNVNEAPTNETLSGGTVMGGAANGTVVGTVHGTDPDAGSVLMYSLVDNPDGRFAIDANTGVITVADGSKLAPGSDAITVRVTDQAGLSLDKSFSILVDDPAKQIVAANEQKATNEDTSLVISAASLIADASDPSGAALTLTSVGNASHGKVTMANGNVTFVPDANFSGIATFDYTLSDGQGHTSTAKVTVDVAPVADAPSLSVTQLANPSANVTRVDELHLNGITVGGEFFSDVATFSDGGYVVAYTDTSYTDGEENAGIRVRIFDANGKGGKDIHVNTTVEGGQYLPKVAILANGDFAIVWNDEGATGGDTSGDAVRGQMYHRDGTKVGGEFIVNTSTTGDQENASIAALPNGGFVVTWQDGSKSGGDASGLSVKAQIFDAGGHKVGGEILLNSITTDDQQLPSVAALRGTNSGNFIAVWEDDSGLNNDGARGGSIKAQMFDSNGNKVGGETLVNTKDMTYVNTIPNVVGLANGGYAVTWQGQSDGTNNPGIDDDDSNIMMQIFDKNGAKVGTQLQVNTKALQYQQAPRITELTNGFLVVTWEDVEDLGEIPNGDNGQIKAQIIDQQGHKIGSEITINSNANGEQHTPAITARPDGSFMITWTDTNIAGDDDDGIKGAIFSVSNGGAPTHLNLSANLTDKDGSETLAVSVSTIPVGTMLTDGVHSFTATAGNTSVDVSSWSLANLMVTPPLGFTGDLKLTVNATATDHATLTTGAATDSKTVSQTVDIIVQPNTTGGAGNDVLFGSSTNDVLTGNGGNDTYLFGHGGGQDRIVNGTATSTAASGELDLGANISDNQLWFQRSGNDLSIAVMGSQDKITVAGWFNGAGSQLQEITAGGMKIDAGVSQLVQAMATYSSTHAGFDPTTATQAPNDAGLQSAIAANWHA